MIGWLSGIVRLRDAATGVVVLDVAGVGHQLMVSLQTLAAVPEIGEPCELWVHTHAREDVLALFGFATLEEKRVFSMLLAVPKIGPRNAISVLSGLPLEELVEAVASGETDTLRRIPGVGKQIALQIVVALKDRVAPMARSLAGATDARPASSDGRSAGLRDGAHGVLTNLGWKSKQVERALEEVMDEHDDDISLDDLVRRVLARLMER
jgi:Holliday junction DNA helicase RuvA